MDSFNTVFLATCIATVLTQGLLLAAAVYFIKRSLRTFTEDQTRAAEEYNDRIRKAYDLIRKRREEREHEEGILEKVGGAGQGEN
jgi:hypothetical protein